MVTKNIESKVRSNTKRHLENLLSNVSNESIDLEADEIVDLDFFENSNRKR